MEAWEVHLGWEARRSEPVMERQGTGRKMHLVFRVGKVSSLLARLYGVM